MRKGFFIALAEATWNWQSLRAVRPLAPLRFWEISDSKWLKDNSKPLPFAHRSNPPATKA